MWQRKQTIYLALTVLLSIVVMVCVGVYDQSPVLYSIALPGVTSAATIPAYNARKKQIKLSYLGILLMVAWVAFFCYDHFVVRGGATMYPLFALLPVVCVVLLWLAIKGIQHDENLIRSMDRIR